MTRTDIRDPERMNRKAHEGMKLRSQFVMFSCFLFYFEIAALMCRVLLFTSAFQCFSVPSSHLSSSRLTPPVPDVCILYLFSLMSLSVRSVFPRDASLCFLPGSPPGCPRWYVSDFCSLSLH